MAYEPKSTLVAQSITDVILTIRDSVDRDYLGKLSEAELRVLTAVYAQRASDVLCDRSFKLGRSTTREDVRAAVAFPDSVLEDLSRLDALIDEGKE